MIRTILIAEKKVLQKRVLWMDSQQCYQLMGSYATAMDAIRKVNWNDVDAVHIQNSELHWTVISEMLLNLNPILEIIFFKDNQDEEVTVIKNVPVHTMNLAGDKVNQPNTQIGTKEANLVIRCFGGLSFSCRNEPIFLPTKKSEEIIAFLAHNRKTPVMRDVIIEALWPDSDAEKGINNFHVNIHNIRKALKRYNLSELLLQCNGYYYLNPKLVYCDMWEFADLVGTLKKLHFSNQGLMERASEIYQGPYLGSNAYAWASDYEYQYERDYETIQNNLYDVYIKEGSFKKAVQAMKTLIHHNPLSAEAYERCIRALISSGNETAALEHLVELENAYRRELNEPLPMHLQNVKKALSTAKYRGKAFLYEVLSG